MFKRQCLVPIVRFSFNHCRLNSTRRLNPLGIQMLSSQLHEQLFSSVGEPNYSPLSVAKSIRHLQKFDLGSNESEILEDVGFKLPPLEGKDLNEHFQTIAQQQSQPYVDLIHQLIESNIPQQPTKWKYTKGWTKFVDFIEQKKKRDF